MIPLDDPTTLSSLFHLNSEPWLNDDAYREGRPSPRPAFDRAVVDEVVLPLPEQRISREPSCRRFVATTLPLTHVSELLLDGYGLMGDPRRLADGESEHRSVPSAGGLYPLELLVMLRRIESLDDGLYRYEAQGHELDLLERGDLFAERLGHSVLAYPFFEHANGLVMMATRFRRTQDKYGPRGYRYILLEAGHVGQNLTVSAARLGLGSLCIGGYLDSRLNAALGLDPLDIGVVYCFAFGVAAPE